MSDAFQIANVPTAADIRPSSAGQVTICAGFDSAYFVPQIDEDLCWAAVLSAMNRSAERLPNDQHAIVTKVFGVFTSRPTPLDVVFRRLGLSIDDRLSGSFDFDKIIDAFSARIPFAVAVSWDSTAATKGHALCLFGWRTNNGSVSHVLVYDPWKTNAANQFVVEIPLSALPAYKESGVAGIQGQWAELVAVEQG